MQSCIPATEPTPTASAACQSQNDPISQACNAKSDIGTAVTFLCDAEQGLSTEAKGVFGALKFLSTGLARGALSIVDAGCKIYQEVSPNAQELINNGCDVWTNIGKA